jgi:H+-transporting ATPase
MTGDGVNDAPALKKADCGIAVSGATDAARAAAAIVLLTPGLSVIIDAIKESRKIFQRMNSYSMYRIAETLRVLLFMTLAILIFNFYPLTAVMIVMLALLNDGAILSIAYDNVRYKDAPEAWNMRMVLGVSTVLGIFGVTAAFGLFYLGEQVFHLDRDRIQTLMYLKMSVAGHLTIFLTRTRGPFWSIRPANILLGAVFGTQAIATLMAVYGVLMHPLGWKWAGFVWGYALIWFLINDRAKLLAYRFFDPVKPKKTPEAKAADDSKPEAKTPPKSNAKANGKSDTKPEPKAEASSAVKSGDEAQPKPEATPPPDLQPQIAKRAYELYEERGRKDGPAGQDWEKAESEVGGNGAKAEAKTSDAKDDSKADPISKGKSEAATQAETKPGDKSEAKPSPQPDLAALIDTKLGDILLAGIVKHPEEVGKIIAEAITDARAPVAAAKAPVALAEKDKPHE